MAPSVISKCSKKSVFGVFLVWGFLMLLVYLQSNSISLFIIPHLAKVIGASNDTRNVLGNHNNKEISSARKSNTKIENITHSTRNLEAGAIHIKDISTPKNTNPKHKSTETNPKPTTTNPKPKTAKPKPTTAKPKPTTAKPKPTTAKPKPTTAKPKPTTAKPKPTTAKPKPTTAKPKPTTAKPKPTTAKPKPTTAKPKPTTAKPKPTTAKSKPTTAKPKPTTRSESSDTQSTPKPRPKQACVHPVLDVNDPAMMKHYKKYPKTVCSGQDWVYVDNGTLHFSQEATKAHKSIACDYLAVVRQSEHSIKLGPAVENITDPFQIKDDAFKIVCKGDDGQTYEKFHQGVAYRKEYVDRKQDPMKEGFEGLGVAILGFDSMSRMSWMRRLPITRKYFVEKLGAIELEQHNILGDGTTAVMFPMLTGKFEWELPECRVHYKGAKPMDDFPWIWHEFKKAGYLTSWSNARPRSAPFNWRMLGFKNPPTDFYARPFYTAAFPRLKGNCLGSQSRHDIWLNWFRDVFHMYKKQRKFLFHFITDFSHDNNNLLTEMDDRIQQLVQHLNDDGYLNNTLLILMGDHGARYGYVRNTISGKLEERLPYFSFLFPRWFQEKYPDAIKNLKTNTRRLTTPFDLHATFKDFFHYEGAGMGNVSDRGISLFKEIPLERTCKHADIASHWCACLDWKEVDINEPKAQNALKTALDTINGYTSEYRSLCALLSVANVSVSSKLEMGRDLLKFRKTDQHGGIYNIDLSSKQQSDRALYQIIFRTQPGGGEFEVTVTHDFKSGRYSLNRKEISRINMYGDAPHCIMDKNRQIQPFCFCKDML